MAEQYSAQKQPLRYCKCDGNVIFIRPFLMLGPLVTLDEHVNELERYWKGDTLESQKYYYGQPWFFSKLTTIGGRLFFLHWCRVHL